MKKRADTYKGRTVVYKEDVAEAMGCGVKAALLTMRRTGRTVKVGNREALYVGDFYTLLLDIGSDRVEKR